MSENTPTSVLTFQNRYKTKLNL